MPTAITDASVTQINTISMTTKSKIEIKYPKDLQLSDPPISGKYYLECSNLDGKTYQTNDIDVNSNEGDVQRLLENDCSFLRGKIKVHRLEETYASTKVGVEFRVDFFGMPGSLKLYRIKSSPVAPLEGKNLKYDRKETRPFGQSIVYKVIPPDYFYTIEEKPQVIVNIDEYPALCVNLDCDYTYID